jgi:hypothetical protein
MAAKVRARYVVDSKGRRREIMLPVRQFEAMVRELEDLRDAQYVDEAEATAEGFVELDLLKRGLQP